MPRMDQKVCMRVGGVTRLTGGPRSSWVEVSFRNGKVSKEVSFQNCQKAHWFQGISLTCPWITGQYSFCLQTKPDHSLC